ncbi:MAG TPA: OsmC family protein [Steroidobacteraceae bacterium]|nr:OsmC family protein [Steroidobacteraceae bacterium]
MFSLTLAPGPHIDVKSKNHQWHYANDGSRPNPLESTYAALAGCAGVYAKKACRELGIDDAGIAISMRNMVKAGQTLIPARIVTTVEFPERFTTEQRAVVLESIQQCAVKKVMQHGPDIAFLVEEEAGTTVD